MVGTNSIRPRFDLGRMLFVPTQAIPKIFKESFI
jgi:hypothetical protein